MKHSDVSLVSTVSFLVPNVTKVGVLTIDYFSLINNDSAAG